MLKKMILSDYERGRRPSEFLLRIRENPESERPAGRGHAFKRLISLEPKARLTSGLLWWVPHPFCRVWDQCQKGVDTPVGIILVPSRSAPVTLCTDSVPIRAFCVTNAASGSH